MSHLTIVGGSDAGISAALHARELDSSTQGLPFFRKQGMREKRSLAYVKKLLLLRTRLAMVPQQK